MTEFDSDEPYKVIEIKFPNGDVYAINAAHIAGERAVYYVQSDGYSDSTKQREEFHREKQYALENDDVLFDWLGNNMDWEDIEPFAELIPQDESDPQEMLMDAEFDLYLEYPDEHGEEEE